MIDYKMDVPLISNYRPVPPTKAVVLFQDEKSQLAVSEEKMAGSYPGARRHGGGYRGISQEIDVSISSSNFVVERDREVGEQKLTGVPTDREAKGNAFGGFGMGDIGFGGLENRIGGLEALGRMEGGSPWDQPQNFGGSPWDQPQGFGGVPSWGGPQSRGSGWGANSDSAMNQLFGMVSRWGNNRKPYSSKVPIPQPKPYAYQDNKPAVDPTIDMGEMNVRKVDIDALNKILLQHGDNFDQYWNQIDKKGFLDEIQNFNGVVRPTDNRPLVDPAIINNKNILISGLETHIIDQYAVEEPGIDIPDGPQPFGINNKVITTIDQSRTVNSLDDIQQLVRDSVKLRDAFRSAGNGKWTDTLFLANNDSIVGFGESGGIPRDVSTRFIWQRPEEFLKGRTISVYETIEPTDIIQGGLGDCYFLAAAASIAEYSPRIERIFLSKKYEPRGIYAVGLCLDGIWEEVVMDDQVPCVKTTGKVAFNDTKNGELWVILAEKAWAKAHGGYYNISAGLTREALRDLSGASAKTFFTEENREELWVRILEANRLKFIMTAGTDDLNSGSDAYIEKLGICGGHAYSLLDAQEVVREGGSYRLVREGENMSGQTVERILKLRNPWGTGEWKGSWSDNSSEWNQSLRQQLNYFTSDDGVFYMNWNDFLKYFSDVQICYFHDNYRYSALKLQTKKDEIVYLKVAVSQPGTYYFSLNQKNRRKFRKKDNYKYSNLNFVIGWLNPADQTVEYIGAGMKLDKENWIVADVKPGELFIRIATPWQSIVDECSFSIYGPGRVGLTRVQSSSLPNDFLVKLFRSHAFKDKSTKLSSFSGQGLSELKYKHWDNKEGYGYLYFVNDGTSKSIDVTAEMLGSSNIQLLPPFSGLRPQVTVDPGKTAIIAYQGVATPYSVQIRFLATVKTPGSDSGISAMVKQSSTVLQKKLNGQPIDIKVYVKMDPIAMYLLYVNNTSQYILSEKVQFSLSNARIDGVYGSHVEVSVKPGKEQLIKIVKVDPNAEFNAKILNLSYDIFKA